MQLISYDYVKARPTGGGSLAKLATLIEQTRAAAAAENEICLLFDNGDTWQGNALAEHLAQKARSADHPLVRSINHLGYDAVGLGNHDFDFGAEYLSCCLTHLDAPVLCSNMQSDTFKSVASEALLERSITNAKGQCVSIKVGVLASVPNRTDVWNRHHLTGKAKFQRPLPFLAEGAARLRAQGADIVVVLAHMGFPLFDEGDDAQNQLECVAGIADVDAVIGGHTHLRFPDQGQCGEALINGKPVVQPGAAGSDLGEIRFHLYQPAPGDRWQITETHAKLIPARSETTESEAIRRFAETFHRETTETLDRPAATIARPMNSYFALASPSPVQGLMAAAKRHYVRKRIAGTDLENMPLIAIASATLTGGLDGPENFISLDAGQIRLRHISGLNPYANQVWAVRTTGARLLDWLERSAVIFNTLKDDDPDQLLINPNIPGFRYDAAYGLSYKIDPRKEPRFDGAGRPTGKGPGRVSCVCFDGRPVDPEQQFLVATTDHRAGGGGIYEPFDPEDIVLRGQAPLPNALLDYLANAPSCEEVRGVRPWQLKSQMGVKAILLSAPEAESCLADISQFAPEACGLTEEGFLRVRLSL